ncbi:uncharacterized protein LOC110986033 [Acanthaster planci]|uniref:Uncharacterized protein LOC110986033 n=1 Tax=Acanthaster planci TaxID=133434 RepID=A0A8B7ZC97_ACAPL|nr:uncharacterized protein LOC110986033 [Acanthaster planci]
MYTNHPNQIIVADYPAKMLFFFYLILFLSLVAEALTEPSCQENAQTCTRECSRHMSQDFNGIANRVLLGHGYRNVTVASLVRCGWECLLEDSCFSFHYSEGEKRCELNGATVSRFPLALIETTGNNYYGPEQPTVAQLIRSMRGEVPLSPTDCWHQTHASASSECQSAGQHLCLQWELQYANKKGYPTTTPDGSWYADPDRLAVLTETGVTYHNLPLTTSAPALCCSLPLSYREPVLTKESYDFADRAGQISGCSDLAAHLCTLAELKEAYDHDYQCVCWYFFATANRDAAVKPGGCGSYSGSECFEGIIAHTPRPANGRPAYCCPNRAQ